MATKELTDFYQAIEKNRVGLGSVVLLSKSGQRVAYGEAILEGGTTGGVFWLQPGTQIDNRDVSIIKGCSREIAVKNFVLASWLPGIYRFTVLGH